MTDYKELIEETRGFANRLRYYLDEDVPYMEWEIDAVEDAADAIEKLINEKSTLELLNHLERCEHDHTRKERDAAVADLTNIVHDMWTTCICDYCIGCVSNGFREGCKTDNGDRWKWRGVQEADDEKERNL